MIAQTLIDDILEMAETFHLAAPAARRLGRGSIRMVTTTFCRLKPIDSASESEQPARSRNDDRFETANQPEEYAARLETLVRREPFQS